MVIVSEYLNERIVWIFTVTIATETILVCVRLAYDGRCIVGECHLFFIECAVALQLACGINNLMTGQEGREYILADVLEPCDILLIAVQLVAECTVFKFLVVDNGPLTSSCSETVGASTVAVTEEVFGIVLVRINGSG